MTDDKSTYHQHAITDAELSAGGRWATGARPRVNGTEPIVRTPADAPQWSLGLAALPQEPSLGIDINEVPACGGEGGQQQ
jgi:hypothetical protein